MHITTTGTPTEEEAAAAIAAITLLLAEEAAQAEVQTSEQPARWRDSMRLMAQGMQPMRVPGVPRWSTIERLRRAGRGGMGIVGM
ncbi:hypothetical protein [Chloroflexus sp.]|uniref:hypothetical protein n=1 Tax=Chloroflexus sp. TaxID=1904827 RepID=UPI00298F07AD|nr:hypothetical protein [Chloroflexus sp.]MCS6887904.1 hypothetical protein [Chloroflexus sp.]MDW8403267.1 hypothetical protein [Chloroflexus sp.]